MKNRFVTVAAMLIINASWYSVLQAQEFAYVTDSLQLRVYSSASDSSEVLQSIDSGDSVEVFATENGFSKVTTYDGTVGWVKSAFLVVDPPAKLLYYSVGEKNKQLEAELELLKNNPQNEIATSSSETDANLINELQAQLEQQQQSNQALQKKLDEAVASMRTQEDNLANEPQESVLTTSSGRIENKRLAASTDKNMKWLFTGSAVLLLLGLLLGVKISTWRMRKRLHGFSI